MGPRGGHKQSIPRLIKHVERLCLELKIESPQYTIFLNDLPGNDFNNIFKSLGSFKHKLNHEIVGGIGPCFFNGVPGSFYGRLFPPKSLHFVHSSYSLHYLSQVPEGVENNKGNIYMGTTSPANVLKAYYHQFQRDFSMFLKCRAQEVVEGGSMVLTIQGRRTENPSSKDAALAHFVFGLRLANLRNSCDGRVSSLTLSDSLLGLDHLPFLATFLQSPQCKKLPSLLPLQSSQRKPENSILLLHWFVVQMSPHFLPCALASSTLGRNGPFSRSCNIDFPVDTSPSRYGSLHLGFAELPLASSSIFVGCLANHLVPWTNSFSKCWSLASFVRAYKPVRVSHASLGVFASLMCCSMSSSTVTDSTYIALPALTFHFLRSSPSVGVPDCIPTESPRTAIPDLMHEHVPAYSNTEWRSHEPGSDTTL
ncbi:salicylate carboxymethyltransferase-like [Senna tora]|uniref:Salicylate carboxymethyltransferase-like n=1 Tax=Senna tora TaxID=362788 RepID=A0A834WA86_9FABA|nr:salicylate carboxymethyltransferase-like [Senna tora]